MNCVGEPKLEESAREEFETSFGLFSEITDCDLDKEDAEKAFQVYFIDCKKRFGVKSKGKGKGGKGKGVSKGEPKGARRPPGTFKEKGKVGKGRVVQKGSRKGPEHHLVLIQNEKTHKG